MSHFSSTEKLDAMGDTELWDTIVACSSEPLSSTKNIHSKSLSDLNLDKPVKFYGYKNQDGLSSPVDCDNCYTMQPDQTTAFIKELIAIGEEGVILETLQVIAVGEDGVTLITAFPSLDEFNDATYHMESVPHELKEYIQKCGKEGADEIVINFEENQ